MSEKLRLGCGASVLILCSLALGQPPGFDPPQPGQIVPGFLRDRLELTAAQKKQVDDLQKDVTDKLGKILSAEQMKTLQEARNPFGGRGPGPGGFGPPGFGPPGGFGPGGFGGDSGKPRMDEVRRQVGSTEEEWKVIGPKLQKILGIRQILAADARAADAGAAPRPDAARTGGDNAPRPVVGTSASNRSNIVSQAQAEFRSVLGDPKHTKADLEEKVAAVRKARQQVRAELDAAQKDLRQLLTADQETILVGQGYLE